MKKNKPHILDRPIWNALAGRQSEFAIGGPLARRYQRDVEPFVATRDDSEEAMAALGSLIVEYGECLMLQIGNIPIPGGIRVEKSTVGVQMIGEGRITPSNEDRIVALDDNDVAEMIALAHLTEPGPFLPRTHRLGQFWGIRDAGRLVAMAGERMKVEGFAEVSGVCTHPDYRGQQFAANLSKHIANLIIKRGETPFLHAYADNQAAIRLYEALGFRIRTEVVVKVIRSDQATMLSVNKTKKPKSP